MNKRSRAISYRTYLVFLISVGLAIFFIARTVYREHAATPASGTIAATGPVAPFTGTWTGTASGGSSPNGEGTCVEGTNCDTFRLTVAPGDYTGKQIAIKISWAVGANDYDLYIHKCPTTASTIAQCNASATVAQGENGGAPATSDGAAIDPGGVVAAATDYTVHVVYFTVAPDQYQASATLESKSTATRAATYISGGMSFSPSVAVKAPVASADGEPSNRTDKVGNFYSVGIRGFPAGVDLWYNDLRPTVNNAANPAFDPFLRNWVYRGQPDAFSPTQQADLGGDGGGDVDLAVSMPDPTTGNLPNPPTLAGSSLIAANISTFKSTDIGLTFSKNNLGNCTGGVCADDRQWEEFFGNSVVYLFYRTLEPAVSQIQRSTDGGLTFGPAQTAGAIGQAGYIDVHQSDGTVYISGSSGQVCHSTVTLPTGEAAVYQCVQAASDANGVAHLFFVVKVADDGTPNGTVYGCYSNDHDIFLVHSTDKGVTWSQPVRVSNGAETKTSVFPWIETGPTPGSVGIVWYGTTDSANDDNANWNVFFAQSFNATADTPTFRQAKVSDHIIHGSNISEGGLTGTANRNLLDYFQVSFDPTGAAVLAFTDDHNDFTGHTYIARQISGPKINGDGKTTVPDPGSPPAAQTGPVPLVASVGGETGAQVTDFRDDVADGLLVRTTTDDPLDILSIRYSCETGTAGEPVIVANMKVSNLAVVPPASNWRMNFTANAPGTGLSPTGDYSFAVSDRGDQFFVQANTDNPAVPTFTFGTTVRNSDGSLTNTSRGNADCGKFDTTNNTITIKVSTAKLNAFASKGAIVNGSILAGLRGQAFTSQVNGKRDLARGGTEFVVGSCSAALAGCAAATATPTPSPSPSPSPSASPATAVFQFDSTAYAIQEAVTTITVRVVRTGVTSTAATVDVVSNDGTAKQRGDFENVLARLRFAAGETQKTFPVLINDDSYIEGGESATLVLQNPINGTLGTPNAATLQIIDNVPETTNNPIDVSRTFVGTHYHDFLYRQSDQSGEDFWTNQIEQCGADAQCRQVKRVNVSQAFFLSIEFKETGYLVIRAHKAAFGSAKSTPRYAVFLRDQREIGEGLIVGQGDWQNQLNTNKQNYLNDFVTRAEFTSIPSFALGVSAATYVDALFANSGATPTTAERNAAISAYGSGDTAGRAAALKSVIESGSVFNAQYNSAFVLMQYYGYLRRNPDDSPDNNFSGYDFWLAKMNSVSQPGEDMRNDSQAQARAQRAEMVRAFIEADEYRQRFLGSPSGNQIASPDEGAIARFIKGVVRFTLFGVSG